MGKVEFGLTVPADALDKARRPYYLADVDRLLTYVTGHYRAAWLIDHLQFGDTDVLEGWTALTYLAARHPALQWGHTVLCQSFRNPALVAGNAMAACLPLFEALAHGASGTVRYALGPHCLLELQLAGGAG